MDFPLKTNQIAVRKRFFYVILFLLLLISTYLLLLLFGGLEKKSKLSLEVEFFSKNLNKVAELEKTSGPMSLNNTRKAQLDIVVFNRIPKVGSEMIADLIQSLGKRNNFAVFRGKDAATNPLIKFESQKNLSTFISDLEQPAAYIKHFAYIDFETHDNPKPIYINMVRDPVEQIISFFHDVRAGWKIKTKIKTLPNYQTPDAEWIQKDFSTCVLNHDPECTFIEGETIQDPSHNGQMVFLCGNKPECLNLNTQEALERTKRNLENEYAVDGVLEDLNTTFAVLEKYIPKFFTGVAEIYYKNVKSLTQVHKNKEKPEISEEIKELLRKNLTRAIEFYDICKKRLKSQNLATLN